MKTILNKIIICIVAIFAAEQTGLSQGFMNLDFEQAKVVSIPEGVPCPIGLFTMVQISNRK